MFLKPIIWEQKSVLDRSEWNPKVLWSQPYLQGREGFWSLLCGAPGLGGHWETGDAAWLCRSQPAGD